MCRFSDPPGSLPLKNRFVLAPVGADRIRPQAGGIERFVEWSQLSATALGFPRGEAGRLDGSSEPARLTDEGRRTVG